MTFKCWNTRNVFIINSYIHAISQVSKLKLPFFVFTVLNNNSSGPTAFLQDLNSDLKVKENRLMLSLKTPTMYISLRMHPLFIAPCLAINLPPSLKCSLFLIINFPVLAFNKQNWNVMNKALPGTDNYFFWEENLLYNRCLCTFKA